MEHDMETAHENTPDQPGQDPLAAGKYPAMTVAGCVIKYCHKKKKKITNLPLQKILFFIQKESLEKTGKDLIQEEFHAWRLGPVIPDVYEAFSIYASFNLPVPEQTAETDKEDREFIESVVEKYIDMPVWDLVEKSHQERPWEYIYGIFGPKSRIPKEFMRTYYYKIDE